MLFLNLQVTETDHGSVIKHTYKLIENINKLASYNPKNSLFCSHLDARIIVFTTSKTSKYTTSMIFSETSHIPFNKLTEIFTH